jgi:hypothetical protein
MGLLFVGKGSREASAKDLVDQIEVELMSPNGL